MKRTVHKFDFVKVPIEATILHIDYDPKIYDIQVWAELPTERRLSGIFKDIRLHSTGYEWEAQSVGGIYSTPRYLRSVVYPTGLVYHLYDYEDDEDDEEL